MSYGQQAVMNSSFSGKIAANRQVTRQVTGRVIDASTKEPIIGVRIQAFNNQQYAAMSGEDGSFSIQLPSFVTSLSFSAEGYNLVVCPINLATNQIQVSLYSDVFTSFYEKQRKATIEKGTAVSNLNADLSIDRQILTGLGGDVRAIMRSGQQGLGAYLLMNGINSLNANAQPLIVIDGVIMDMQYNRMAIHDGFYNHILTNISVGDIENVTVLKNGTALYGAKGANGVILINTKRNKSMATKIDLDLTGSFEQMPRLLTMMNATDYRYYASELLGTTGTKLTDFKFLKSDPSYYYYKQYHNNTDWKKEVYRDAFSQQYGINVQGGDEIASYNLSVGYSNANSTLKDFNVSRFNLRLNSDISLSEKLNVRFDASYSDVSRDLRDDGVPDDLDNTTITSVGLLGLIKAPFLSPYQYDIYGNRSHYLSDADDY
jgi:TonB-dependent SusC/RagA subfamily outer membrane receptor